LISLPYPPTGAAQVSVVRVGIAVRQVIEGPLGSRWPAGAGVWLLTVKARFSYVSYCSEQPQLVK